MLRAMMPEVTTDTLTGLATDMSRVTGTSRATAQGGRSRGRHTTDRRRMTAFGAVFGRDALGNRRGPSGCGRFVTPTPLRRAEGVEQLAAISKRCVQTDPLLNRRRSI